MDKQRKNIALLPNGDLRLKTLKVITPHNPIIKVERGKVYIRTNKVKGEYKYTVVIPLEKYIMHSCYYHNIKMNSSDPTKGSVVMDTGYSQVALTSLFSGHVGSHTKKPKEKAIFRTIDRLDLSDENYFFVSEHKLRALKKSVIEKRSTMSPVELENYLKSELRKLHISDADKGSLWREVMED